MSEQLRPSGAAERIRHAALGAPHSPDDTFRTRAAVSLAIVAVLLAVCNLGGENARKRAIIDSVHAGDVSVSHEAAVTRQLQYQISADNLAAAAALSAAPPNSPARQDVQRTIDQQRALVAHPPPSEASGHGPAILTEGTSIQELEQEIRQLEGDRDRAEQQNEFFEFATAFLEVSLVLGSVAILVMSRAVLGMSLGAAGIGLLVTLNGFLLLVHPWWL